MLTSALVFAYTKLVDDRLDWVESEIQKLGINLPDGAGKASDAKPIVGIERMSTAQWKPKAPDGSFNSHTTMGENQRRHLDGDKYEPKVRHVIEVMLDYSSSTTRRHVPNESDEPPSPGKPRRANTGLDSTALGAARNDRAISTPPRVRVRSKLILKILEQLSEFKFFAGDKEKCVFLRPYKLFTELHDKIDARVTELEKKHQGRSEAEPPESTAQTEKKDDSLASGKLTKGKIELDLTSYEALQHLRLLKDLLDTDLYPVWELRRQLSQGSLKTVQFRDLWHLFQRGHDVVSSGDQPQVYRILDVSGGRPALNKEFDAPSQPDEETDKDKDTESAGKEPFLVECYSLASNGRTCGPVMKVFRIRRFEGEREVTTLPIYPLHLAKQATALKQTLIQRGKDFIQYCKVPTHKEYAGLTLDDPKEEIDSQVMVDFEFYFQRNASSRPKIEAGAKYQYDYRETSEYIEGPLRGLGCLEGGCCGNDVFHRDYDVDTQIYQDFMDKHQKQLEPKDPGELDSEDLILLPNKLFGFVLRTRKWAALDISTVKDVDYSTGERGFQDLQLPKGHKETVLAMVQNHKQGSQGSGTQKHTSAPSMDLVRGKGKGLVMLLHGEPGVGKTSTAECVADYTKSPLFPVTCGDIGADAVTVESQLEKIFQLAHRWKCVLLLDEADVFLAARTLNDLTRNTIVSVFLRTLEYYSGILFLTTNRVGRIDNAFKSRIHVSLRYPRLSLEATEKIWQMHLDRTKELKSEEFVTKSDGKKILRFARSHYEEHRDRDKTEVWNGRQIRNAFQTAIAIAEYEAKNDDDDRPQLTKDHFKQVAKASEGFDRYLKSVYNSQTVASVAKANLERNDEFEDDESNSISKSAKKQKLSYDSSDDDERAAELEAKLRAKEKKKRVQKKALSSDESSEDDKDAKKKTKSKRKDSESEASSDSDGRTSKEARRKSRSGK